MRNTALSTKAILNPTSLFLGVTFQSKIPPPSTFSFMPARERSRPSNGEASSLRGRTISASKSLTPPLSSAFPTSIAPRTGGSKGASGYASGSRPCLVAARLYSQHIFFVCFQPISLAHGLTCIVVACAGRMTTRCSWAGPTTLSWAKFDNGSRRAACQAQLVKCLRGRSMFF
jgi:hypothetical protein